MRAGDDRQHPKQQSYLLRLWCASDNGSLRVTLIAIAPQAPPRHFADLDMLLDFLLSESPSTQGHSDARDHCTPDDAE